jgi:hypothetical protein
VRRGVSLLFVLILSSPPARAQEQPVRPHAGRGSLSGFTFGGSFGVGFGSVTWVSVSGEVGYLATDRLWVGTSGMFRYTDDSRYEPSFHAVDYGVGAFGRYFVFDRFFADTEWTWTSYESRTGGSSATNSISSFFVGGGYAQGLGGPSVVLLEVLYDVTGNAQGLYGTPWVIRAGFATGF